MEINSKDSLQKILSRIETEYSHKISKNSSVFFILTIENFSKIIPNEKSPGNKYRQTIGIPIKDISNYDTREIKGNLFSGYVQLESGIIIPSSYKNLLEANTTQYNPARKITICHNPQLIR